VVFIFIVAAAAAIVGLAYTAPFPFLLEAFKPSKSVWHMTPAPGGPPSIYLTFDDGPNPDWTPPLLDALRETDARATFFLIDAYVNADTAAIVKRIADEGHAIGLHSGTRRLMVESPDDLANILRKAALRIGGITGRPPCPLFRPHAGWRSGAMYRGLDQAGYRLAGWSWGMWDFDWGRRHHKNPRADRRHAADTVRLLVPKLRSQGFTFMPLCGA
jgi:peptidoglycan/xylan/chitin deacetylase (PgdA/CDA1 family)